MVEAHLITEVMALPELLIMLDLIIEAKDLLVCTTTQTFHVHCAKEMVLMLTILHTAPIIQLLKLRGRDYKT